MVQRKNEKYVEITARCDKSIFSIYLQLFELKNEQCDTGKEEVNSDALKRLKWNSINSCLKVKRMAANVKCISFTLKN